MTWTGMLTVTKIVDHKDDTYTVTAEGVAGDMFSVRYGHGQEFEHQAVNSNTEGAVQTIKLELTVKGECFLEKGNILNASGHFDKQNVMNRVTKQE